MAASQVRRVQVSGIASVIPLLTGLPLALVAALFFELSSANTAVIGFSIGAIATWMVIATENRTTWTFAPARHALSLFLAAIVTAIWMAGICGGIFVLGPIINPPPPEDRFDGPDLRVMNLQAARPGGVGRQGFEP